MGGYATRIGNYSMHFYDWELSKLRGTSKTREYFEKKKIEVSFITGKGDSATEENLHIPLTKIFKIKKDKSTGKYSWDWDSFDLRKVLWLELIKRKIDVYLRPYVFSTNHNFEISVKYYLESPLLDKRIQLYFDTGNIDKKPKPVLIEGYEVFGWFDKNCLSYE